MIGLVSQPFQVLEGQYQVFFSKFIVVVSIDCLRPEDKLSVQLRN